MVGRHRAPDHHLFTRLESPPYAGMPDRPSVDDVMMQCAFAWSLRGTCSRLYVGSLFARGGRIISTGYNGAPVGMPHCVHDEYRVQDWAGRELAPPVDLNTVPVPEWFRPELRRDDIGEYRGNVAAFDNGVVSFWYDSALPNRPTCTRAVHAEANAVAFAARYGVALDGSTLFTTTVPCLTCAQLVVNVGAVRVVAAEPYRNASGLELLLDADVEVKVLANESRTVD